VGVFWLRNWPSARLLLEELAGNSIGTLQAASNRFRLENGLAYGFAKEIVDTVGLPLICKIEGIVLYWKLRDNNFTSNDG